MTKPVETSPKKKLSIKKDAIRTLEVSEAEVHDDPLRPPFINEATPPKRKPTTQKGTGRGNRA